MIHQDFMKMSFLFPEGSLDPSYIIFEALFTGIDVKKTAVKMRSLL